MAPSKNLKIIMLFDLSMNIPPEKYQNHWKTEDWKNESHIMTTLKKLGHEVIPIGVHNDIEALIEKINEVKPDLVFNLSEAFAGNRDFEPHLVALLELLHVPYTGAGPGALRLCTDKGMTKEILGYHRLKVPHFQAIPRGQPVRSLKSFPFPAFVKPLNLEASEGISKGSVVQNHKEALERIKYVHQKLGVDAIIEEYIDGRELYVSVLGNDRLTVFPPRELFFRDMPKGEPKIATFRAKWDDAYRAKWGIDSGFARPMPAPVEEKLFDTCKKIYRLLQMRGYGRIDLRVKENGEIFFIEANPNPSIARDDDFARSAAKAGLDYSDLIDRIVALAA